MDDGPAFALGPLIMGSDESDQVALRLICDVFPVINIGFTLDV